MSAILKTLLNFISVVVLCSALAACAPSQKLDEEFSGYYSGQASTNIGVHSILD